MVFGLSCGSKETFDTTQRSTVSTTFILSLDVMTDVGLDVFASSIGDLPIENCIVHTSALARFFVVGSFSGVPTLCRP